MSSPVPKPFRSCSANRGSWSWFGLQQGPSQTLVNGWALTLGPCRAGEVSQDAMDDTKDG